MLTVYLHVPDIVYPIGIMVGRVGLLWINEKVSISITSG